MDSLITTVIFSCLLLFTSTHSCRGGISFCIDKRKQKQIKSVLIISCPLYARILAITNVATMVITGTRTTKREEVSLFGTYFDSFPPPRFSLSPTLRRWKQWELGLRRKAKKSAEVYFKSLWRWVLGKSMSPLLRGDVAHR